MVILKKFCILIICLEKQNFNKYLIEFLIILTKIQFFVSKKNKNCLKNSTLNCILNIIKTYLYELNIQILDYFLSNHNNLSKKWFFHKFNENVIAVTQLLVEIHN